MPTADDESNRDMKRCLKQATAADGRRKDQPWITRTVAQRSFQRPLITIHRRLCPRPVPFLLYLNLNRLLRHQAK